MTFIVPDPLWHDGAQYRPAMQPWYSNFVCMGAAEPDRRFGRTQGRIAPEDLDLLSGDGLATIPSFLQSAPNGLGSRPCMVSCRSKRCNGLIDSGGYQISTSELKLTENLRYRMLRYSEQFEAACILDAPTSTIGRTGSGFYSMDDCLAFTVESGLYTIENRIPGRTRFLNVLQGRSPYELCEWLTVVKPLNDTKQFGERALEDWALAGATRLNFSLQLPALIELRDDGLIREGACIHVLGTGHPEVGCALTAVQDGLRETIDPAISVSFDSATPFLLAGKYKKAVGTPSLTRQKLYVPVMPMPNGNRYVGSDLPWPCKSPFADRLTLGDLSVHLNDPKTAWDSYSHVLLAAHNVWILSSAIAEANRRLRLQGGDARSWLPRELVEMTEVIRAVLRSETPMRLVRQHAELLDRLSRKSRSTKLINDPEDDDR